MSSIRSFKHLFIFAGELSGDMHGGNLLAFLKRKVSSLKITGVGGPLMRQQNIESVLRMEDFEVMGFSDILKSFPRLRKQFYTIRDHIITHSPDVALFIDSGAFVSSLRMAKALRQKGYKGKIIQYISPAVWAWGEKRIEQMANHFDLLLTIYPFEPDYFKKTSLKAKFVGHPSFEIIKNHQYDSKWKTLCGLKEEFQEIISLFPGSRTGEINRNLGPQLEAAENMQKLKPEAIFAVSCANEKEQNTIQKNILKSSFILGKNIFIIPKKYTFELMRASHSSIAKSGTVTLELALHGCPSVVVYDLTFLNWFIAKYILKVNLPFYCIVNILKNGKVFPEVIGRKVFPSQIFNELKNLHIENSHRTDCLNGCNDVQSILAVEGASQNAANAILELFG